MAEIVLVAPLFEKSPAPHRRFSEIVVFVHHYGGHRHSFRRQIEFVNSLGFDAVTFDLPSSHVDALNGLPFSRDWQFGLRHVWADKIEDVLGSFGEKKFVYSFSFPSVSALAAIRRRHAIDIKGWICDSGPFKRILEGVEHLVSEGKFNFVVRGHDLISKNPLFRFQTFRRAIALLAAEMLGRVAYESDADAAMKALPQAFPVLSFRGEHDSMVSPDMIDEMFSAAFGHIDLQRVTLPNAGHLSGIKDDADMYKAHLEGYLLAFGTPI